MKTRFLLLLAACLLLAIGITPVLAQVAPKIAVAPAWNLNQQLTSLDTNGPIYPGWEPNDDYRYVDALINVTTSVEFWAVELSCTVNDNVLDTFAYDGNQSTGDWGDDQRPVWWGPVWDGMDGWVPIPPTFSSSAGLLKVVAAASKQGRNTPFGRNGVNTTFTLATLRYRVQPQVSTFTGTSPLNCTFTFLDRNGKSVLAPTYTAPAPLNIISGFTITGTVSYQARTVKTGIGVDCYVNGNPLPSSPKVTDAAGAFTFAGVRQLGWAECFAFGNISNPAAGQQPDIYLTAREAFDLNERGSYRFLPLELKAGNVNQADCGSGQCINNDDIVTLTNAWNLNASGDANGDGKSDKSDLAIIAGNMNYGENVSGDHILFSLARGWTTKGRDSRIWRGDNNGGAVTQQVTPGVGTSDFWGTLSPDGSTVVFVRKTPGTGTTPARYELFKAPAAGGAAAVLLTKVNAGNLDAFAPSWSPDGTRIAFVCSSGYGWEYSIESGYGFNAGALCLVDATGRNFRQLTNMNAAKIFPPTWEGSWLIYGATGNNGGNGCNSTLCIYDVMWNSNWRLDDNIPSADTGEIADMPVMSGGWLFYRYTDNVGDKMLRVIDRINYDSCGPSGCDYVNSYTAHPAACPGPATARPDHVHTDVVYDHDLGPGCDYQPLDVNHNTTAPFVMDYYEVSPYGWELLFYGDDFASDWFYHSGYRHDLNLEGNNSPSPCDDGGATTDSERCFPEWWPNTGESNDSRHVDSYITNDWWDWNWEHGTLRHAERASIDWNP